MRKPTSFEPLPKLWRIVCDLPMQMVALALCTRLILMGLAWHVGRLIPPQEDLGSPHMLTVWGNWDTWHFVTIGVYGYDRSPDGVNVAFFPVYPALLGIAESLFGSHLEMNDYRWVAVIISTVFLLLTTWLLTVFYRQLVSDEIAALGVVLFLISPFSFFLNAGYTESLFILLVVATFLLARRQQWLLAAMVVAIATATRLPGVFLVPTLLLMAWRRDVGWKKLIAIAIVSPLGIVFYMAWQWVVFGNPFRFYVEQRHWGGFQERTWNYVAAFANDPIGWIRDTNDAPTLMMNFLVCVLWALTLVPMHRRFGVELTFFSGLVIAQSAIFIISQGRMLLPAIGVYLTLAAIVTDRPRYLILKYSLLSAFAMSMMGLGLLFANGQWVV